MLQLLYHQKNRGWRPDYTFSPVEGIGLEKEFAILKDGEPIRRGDEHEDGIKDRLDSITDGFPVPEMGPAVYPERLKFLERNIGKDFRSFYIENVDEAIGSGYMITPEYFSGPGDPIMGVEIRTLPCSFDDKPAKNALEQIEAQEKILYETFEDGEFSVVPLPARNDEMFVSPSMHLHVSFPDDAVKLISDEYAKQDGGNKDLLDEIARDYQASHTLSSYMRLFYPLITSISSNTPDKIENPNHYNHKSGTVLDNLLEMFDDSDDRLPGGSSVLPRFGRGTVEMRSIDSMVSPSDSVIPVALVSAFVNTITDTILSYEDGGTGSDGEKYSLINGPVSTIINFENMKRVARDGVEANPILPIGFDNWRFYMNHAPGTILELYKSGKLAEVGKEQEFLVERSVGEHIENLRDDLMPHLKDSGLSDRDIRTIFSADKCQSFNQERIGDEDEVIGRAMDDSRKGNSWFAKRMG